MKNIRSENTVEDQTKLLESARAGDQRSFEQLIELHRHELLVHSYRFLGSFEDVEDAIRMAWNGCVDAT